MFESNLFCKAFILAFCIKAAPFNSHNLINQGSSTSAGEEATWNVTEILLSATRSDKKGSDTMHESDGSPNGAFGSQQRVNSVPVNNTATNTEPEEEIKPNVTNNGNITVGEPSSLNPSLTDITSTSTEPEDVTKPAEPEEETRPAEPEETKPAETEEEIKPNVTNNGSPNGAFASQQRLNSVPVNNTATNTELEEEIKPNVTNNGNVTVDEPSGLNLSLTDITSTSTQPEEETKPAGPEEETRPAEPEEETKPAEPEEETKPAEPEEQTKPDVTSDGVVNEEVEHDSLAPSITPSTIIVAISMMITCFILL